MPTTAETNRVRALQGLPPIGGDGGGSTPAAATPQQSAAPPTPAATPMPTADDIKLKTLSQAATTTPQPGDTVYNFLQNNLPASVSGPLVGFLKWPQNFGTAALDTASGGYVDKGLAKVGQLIAPYTGITPPTLQQIRADTQAARERLGPYGNLAADITGAAPAVALGTARFGANLPSLVGQGTALGTVHALGHDTDPYAGGFWGGVGGLGGWGLGKAVGAAGRRIAEAFGGGTAEDVAAKTAADVAASTKAASDLQYNYPSGAEGFRTGVQVQTPIATPGGQDIPSLFVSKQPASALDLGKNIQWLNEVMKSGDQSGAAPLVAKRLNTMLDTGTPIGAEPGAGRTALDTLAKAQSRQDWSDTLSRWANTQGLPGVEVRRQATEALGQLSPGAPEYDAVKRIAAVAPRESIAAENLRPWLSGAGSWAGGTVWPGGGHIGGAMIGNQLADALATVMSGSRGVSPLVQQQIARAYPAMTGYSVAAGRGLAAQNALQQAMATLALSQAGRPLTFKPTTP